MFAQAEEPQDGAREVGGGDKEALLQKSGQGDCDFEVCIKIKRLLFEGLTPKVQNSRST